MPENSPGESKGLFESLSTFGATMVAVARTRLELLTIDIEEERERLSSILLITLAAAFLLGIGIVLAVILLVVAYWETNRLMVLSVLTAFFLLLGAALVAYAIQKTRSKPSLFASSLSEVNKDQQQLSSRL